MTAFISYLSLLGSKVLSWRLQYFEHILSKKKDTKSIVSIFLELKSAIGYLNAVWCFWHQIGAMVLERVLLGCSSEIPG